jgi:hypothetical protein
VRTKTLRATNFRFLDDPTEINYGLELVRKRIEAARGRTQANRARQFWKRVDTVLANVSLSEFYLCCFTHSEDDVALWRGFGSGPVRCALGFEPMAFHSIAKSVSGRFANVIYTETRQRLRLNMFIGDIVAAVRRFPPRAQDMKDLPALVARHLARLITRFKSAKYESERESRIIIENPDPSAVSFDTVRGYLRPYVPVLLPLVGKQPVLTELWLLAPGRFDTARRAADLAMKREGIVAPIYNSSVPIVL